MGLRANHYAAFTSEHDGGRACLCGLRHIRIEYALLCMARHELRAPGLRLRELREALGHLAKLPVTVKVGSFWAYPRECHKPGGHSQLSALAPRSEWQLQSYGIKGKAMLARLAMPVSPWRSLPYCVPCDRFGTHEHALCSECGGAMLRERESSRETP